MLSIERQARILTWLGVWKPGQKCLGTNYAYPRDRTKYCGDTRWPHYGPHDIPQPPLTAEHALAALEKLRDQIPDSEDCLHDNLAGRLMEQFYKQFVFEDASLKDAIFVAVDAYLESLDESTKTS